MEKTDFDTHYIRKQSLNLLEKLAGNHNICKPSYNISFFADVLVLP